METNFVFDYGTEVARRYLARHSARVDESVARLSSGTRVNAARDDAAALAVGTGLRVEVASLRQASVNVGQAVSMLQIADAGLAKLADALNRMRALAVQAGSEHLSAFDRVQLDGEFTQLRAEIDRISEDTSFGETPLLNFGFGPPIVTWLASNLGDKLDSNKGFEDFIFADNPANISEGDVLRISYDNGSQEFTILNVTTGDSTTAAGPANPPPAGTFIDVAVPMFDLTIRLNDSFNPGVKNEPPPGNPSKNEFTVATEETPNPIASREFVFNVGSGVSAEDEISVVLDSAMVLLLDSDLPTASLLTASLADQAASAVDGALDSVAGMRARIGADMNRLEFAAGNLVTSVENLEAGRSALLDLDVAAETQTLALGKMRSEIATTLLSQSYHVRQSLLRLLDNPAAPAAPEADL